jgi:hypothetical protein
MNFQGLELDIKQINLNLNVANKNMTFDESIETESDSGFISSDTLEISDETIIPPSTPSSDELAGVGAITEIAEEERQSEPTIIKRGDGKMPYIKDEQSREMLENAWQAINLTENWDFVAQPTESFQFSQDNRIWIITEKMEQLGYYRHSGFSFGWTMRQMQFLARNGVEKFKNKW